MVSFNRETQGTVKNALIGSPRPESMREGAMSGPGWVDTGGKSRIMGKLS